MQNRWLFQRRTLPRLRRRTYAFSNRCRFRGNFLYNQPGAGGIEEPDFFFRHRDVNHLCPAQFAVQIDGRVVIAADGQAVGGEVDADL